MTEPPAGHPPPGPPPDGWRPGDPSPFQTPGPAPQPPGAAPPGGWPTASYGAGGGAPRPSGINVGAVIGGVLLGAVLNFAWLFVVLVAGFAGLSGSANTSTDQQPLVWLVLVVAALPMLVAVGMMFFRKTRQLGAGLMMGVAIGSIAGAGMCAAPWLLLSQSAGG